MAAVVSSSSLGLLNSSLYVLGSQGALGQPTQGRSGEQVFVNGSTGNLVIQNRDELVVGRGPDLSLLRTYNSQGLFDGDNNDNWRFGVYRKVTNLTGTVNTAGSTVTRVAEDGSESLYAFDTTLGKYVCHDGGGSFDTLTFTSATQTWTWSWSDGTNQLTELYDNANGGRITKVQDQDGNGLTFTYTAGLITQVTDADGETTFLDYTGTDLTQLRTVTGDTPPKTIIRTSYAYDGNHRLIKVTTDLTPDNTADSSTYVVNYTYDDTNGPSKRVATLAQSDGTRLTFAYVQIGTDFKVSSITDALGQVTSFSYGTTATTTTVNANPAVLTTPTVGWAGASLLETSATAASQPRVGFDAAGNGIAVWVQGTDVLASRYTKSTGTWSATTVLDENNNAISALQLYVDASGNAIASWVQSDGAAPSTYQNRYRFGAWIGTQTVESAAGLVAEPAGSINANGDSAMVWRQANATGGQDLYANRRPLGTGWTGAVLIETGAGAVGTPAVAIDAQGNIQAVWQQNDGTVDSIYSSRYTAAAGWSAPILIESSAAAASSPRIGLDSAGNAIAVWVQGADLVSSTYTKSTGLWSAISVLDSNANAISAPTLYVDPSGNAIASWVQSDGIAASVYANRLVAGVWTGAQLLESAAGIANEPTASINAGGNAVVLWRQTNVGVEDLYASRFTGGAWTAAQSIESGTANAATPAVSIDAQGNIHALWQQSDGAAVSIYANRYVADATPYYTVQGTSWAAVAQAVYGTAAAAGALQAVVGNPALTPGVRLAAPASLTYSTVTAPANTTGLPTSDTQTTTQTFNANTAALTPQTGNPNPLPNWVPVTNLSAAAGTWLVYQLEVPVGQTELFVATSGGTGNANLYVRRGAAPTTTLFDASSTGTSNTESVRIANPAAGTWYVGVLASAAFSGLRLEGHYQSGTAGTTILKPGQAVSDLYGKANNTRNFSFEIPAGTTSFRLTLSGSGAGEDADLYMTYNAPVNLGAAGFWSEGPVVDETITVDAPSAGTWNLVVKTWSSSLSDATLLLQTDLGANTAPTVQGGAPQRALPGALVSLAATASDAQGALSYQWTQLRGPAVTLTNAATATASFIAPNAPGPTQLDFQVRVTDSNGATNTDVVHVLVDAPLLGYVVQTATWDSVASAIYGSAAVATQLQTALGNPALTVNSVLKNLPATLSTSTTATVTVAPYYTVQTGNTWATIAQAVYGTSDPGAAEALRDALGNPALTSGTKIAIPQSLTYSVPGSQSTGSGRTVDVTDALGKVTTMVTNALGQLTQILNPAVGGVRQSVSYTYNANGDVTQVTDARGLVTTYDYDANGNRKLERDAAGNTITRVYGSKNELQTETSYIVPDPDGAGAGQPGTPLTTRYVYDANAHLRFAISAEGRVTEYRYNTFGQRVAAIQYTGQYTGALYDVSTLTPIQTPTEAQLVSFVNAADKTRTERIDSTYDFRGQLQTTTSYGKVDAAGVGVNDSDKAVTNYVYDQTGNLTNTVDGRGSSTAYVYDGLGRLTKTTDAAGHPPITTFYDDVNKKTVLTSANGLVTTSTYDAKGELISVLQSVGVQGLGTTSFFYDADGRLRRTVDPTVPTGISTHILYDEAGRRIATIDGTGTLTEYRYDADNNLTRSIQYATAVSAANLASLTDALGNPTSVALAAIRPAASGQDRSSWNAYDSANRLVKSVDELGYITQYFYDGAGRLTDVLRSAKAMTSTAALGDTPTAASIAPAATDPLDRRTRNFYDADGKLRGTLDGEGYLVEYKYDAAGQLVESVGYSKVTDPSPTLRATGTLAQLIPTENASELQNDIHSYTLYNAKGQVIGTVDAEGFLTESVYDAAGNKKQVIRYATKVVYSAGVTLGTLRPAIPNVQDRTSNFTYTALNQLASASDFEGTTTSYTYDEVGNLTQSVKAVGTSDARTSSAQYDKQGRLIAQMDGKGSPLLIPGQTQAQIDAVFAANGTRYNYDASGRRTSSIDANGNKTLYYYDADGHLTHTINAVGEVTESKYNVLGQLTQTIAYGTRIDVGILGTPAGGLANTTLTNAITGPTGIANASLDSVTTYSYTARGQVASSTDPLQFATTNTYDAFGDLTVSSQQIGAGATRDHTYDFDRRGLLTRTVWDPSFVNASELRQYDAFGRVTQTTDANGNVRTRSYDRLGRTVSTTLDPGAGHLAIGASTTYDAFDRVLTQTDALGNSTSFVYSTANRSVTMTTPEGIGMTTVHNRQGETQSVTDGRGNITKYDYDQDGMLKQVTLINAQGQTVSTTTSIYDKADRLTDTVDANGNTVHFTYDAANRVLTRVVDPGAGHLNLTTTYEYDAKGQKTKVTDANNTVTQTVFDLKGQVTSVIVDPGTGHLNLTTTYSYVGKKTLTVTEGVGGTNPPKVTKYTYDNLGRRTQEQVDPSGLNLTTTYTYDKNGNVVSKTEAAGKPEARTTRYVYDAADRLVWTIDALGDVTKNEYNAEGRVTRSIGYANALVNFATLPASPTAGDVTSRLTLAAGDQADSHVYDKDGRETYAIDALGYVTQKIYDGSGNVTQEVRYATALRGTFTQGVAPQILASVPATPPAGSYVVVDPLDQITRTAYDAAGRALSRTHAQGTSAEYTETNAYDGVGNVIRHTDGRGNSEWFAFDRADRRTRHIDALGFVTGFTYDNVGRLQTQTSYMNAVALPTIPDDRYAYNAPNPVPNPDTVSGDRTTRYTYDRAGRLISELNSVGATIAYSPQQLQANSNQFAQRPVVAHAADGSGFMAWVESDGTRNNVYVNRFVAGSGWQGATLVETDNVGSAVGTVQLAVDAAGDAVVVWEHSEPGLGGNIWANYYINGQGWQGAQRIEAAGGSASNSKVVMDGAGNATVIWTEGSPAAFWSNRYVRGQGWQTAQTIAAGIQYQIAGDAAGNVSVIWRGSGGVVGVWLTQYVAGQGWLPATQIASIVNPNSAPSAPSIATDAAGNSVIAWDQTDANGVDNIYVRRFIVGQGWQAIEIVGTHPGPPLGLDVSLSASGAALVTWSVAFASDSFVADIWSAYYLPGQGWQAPAPMNASSALTPMGVQNGIDSGGNAFVAWVEKAGSDVISFTPSQVWIRRYLAGKGWQAAVQVGQTSAATFKVNLAADMNAAGNVLVSWDGFIDTSESQRRIFAYRIGSLGVETRYQYDALGNLTDKIEAAGLAEQRTTHTVYDAAGRLLEQTTAFGLPEAATRRFGYDALGNQTSDLDPRGVDLAERDTDWATAERPRLGYAKFASALTAAERVSLRALYTTTHVFDRLGRQTSATDPLGNTTRTDYDAFGNVVRAIDPNGNAGYLYYDQRNLLVAQIDPEGDLTEYEYDAAGNKTKTTRYAIPVSVPYDPSRPLASIRPKGLSLPGTSGSYAVTPDSAANSVTGDIDMRVLLTHDSWAPALAETFITKDDLATNRDYGFRFNSGSTGKLQFVASPDGVTTFPNADNVTGGYSVVSTAATGFAPGSTHWLRVTRSATTGQIKFYTSDDYDASTNTGTWTQLGDTIAAPTGPIHDGAQTSVLQVGSRIGPAGSDNPLKGTIYYADVRKVIDGTGAAVVAKFDPSGDAGSVGATSFTSSSSTHETWTLSGTAAVVAGNPQDEITKTSYDALGRVTQVVDAEGHTELFGYDRSTNNVNFHQDKNGNVTTYEYDADGNKKAEHLPVATPIWLGSQLIETDDRGAASAPQIAFDPQGNAISVWSQSDGVRSNIFASRYSAATRTWQGAQLIETDDRGNASAPSIAFDPQGNAIAVWQQSDGVRTNIYANRYSAATGTWQGAQLIETDDRGNAGGLGPPRIALGAQGNAIAVWAQSDGVRTNVYANRYVAATGTWQGAQLLETNDFGPVFSPQIAMDAQGNAIAVWGQSDSARNIYANRYVAATGTWQGAQLLETNDFNPDGVPLNAFTPQIAFDAQGNAVAVWIQLGSMFNNVYANRYVAATGTWQGAQLIETDDRGAASAPQIAFDPQGNAIAVWSQSDGVRINIYASRYVTATGSWQGAQLIENIDSGSAATPQIAMDARGNALVVWQQFDGVRNNIYANQYLAATNAWQAAQSIELGDGTATNPLIAMDAQGNAIATWEQSDGTRTNILTNSRPAVVNRYEYDALGNKTKEILAQGLLEERVTQYVYDKNNRLTETVEPQVLTQQTGAAAPRGSLQMGQAGTATYAFFEILSSQSADVRVDVSWPPIIGFGNGNIKVVWKTGTSLGDFTQIVGPQATSASVAGHGPAVLLAQSNVFEVSIYKQVSSNPLDDVLITRATGNYPAGSANPTNPIDATSQIPNLVFSGQPPGGQTMHVVYRPATDPGDVTAVDLRSYAPGTFAGMSPRPLAPGVVYVYDAQLLDANGQVLNVVTGTFSLADSLQLGQVGAATYAFRQVIAGTGASQSSAVGVDVSWSPIIGFGSGNIKVVWKTGTSLGDFTKIVGPLATSASLSNLEGPTPSPVPLAQSNVFEVSIYKQVSSNPADDVLITRATGNYPAGSPTPANSIDATSQIPNLVFTGQPPSGQTMHVVYWPATDSGDVTEVDFKSYAPGTFAGTTLGPLAPGVLYVYDAQLFDANGEVVNVVNGTFSLVNGVVSTSVNPLPLPAGVLQTPHVFKAYDAAGNLVQETDAKGNITRSYYDANNRLIGTVDAERILRRYSYDGAGNLIAQRTYGDPIPTTVGLTALPPDPAAIAGMDPANFREATYHYNANNVLTETDTREVLVYDRTNGLNPSQALVTRRQYDKNGNVILETDANGNKTYSYYDKAGRRIAQVDASTYLITWAYDAMGNVVRKTSYATALTGVAISTSSDPNVLAAQAAAGNKHSEDRVCLYAYDRMNRLIRETTLGVNVSTVVADTSLTTLGTSNEQLTDIVVVQRYDNAGNLTARIQDTAETDFLYDGLNRVVQEIDPSFKDFNGLTVRSTKMLTYDGVGNLKQVNENGSVTSYEYDAHGNLTREIDPNNNPTRYYYDLNGNVTVKHTRHVNPDGTAPGLDAVYGYDKLNRQIARTESRNFTYSTRYDAYGEITGKGLKGGSQEFEEYEEYDRAGRLIKTNKDDGVDRAYLYDANGNATATIQSGVQDIDLRSMTIDLIAALPVATVQRTESSYDAKNQLTGVFQAPIPSTQASPNAQEVFVDALGNPFLGGTMTAMLGGTASYAIHEIRNGVKNTFNSVDVSWPPIVGYGDGNIKIVWNTGNSKIGASGLVTAFADKDATSALLTGARGESHPNFAEQALPKAYTISIYKQTVDGDVLITTVSASGTGNLFDNPTTEQTTSVSSTVKSVLHFDGLRRDAQKLRLWLWPVGGNKAASVDLLPLTAVTTGNPPTTTSVPGHFVFDWSATMPAGLYNYEYQTLDSGNNVFDYVRGTVDLGRGWQAATSINTAGAVSIKHPQVAEDANHNAIAVWVQTNPTGPQNLFVNRYSNATASWQGVQTLSTSSVLIDLPRIAVDAAGNATVVWMTGGTVFARRYDVATGIWGAVQSLGSGAQSQYLQLAVNAQGNAVAVWRLSGTAGIAVSTYSGGAWQVAQVLATGTTIAPKVALDAQGNAIAVWDQFDGVSFSAWARRFASSTGMWDTAQLIETNSGSVDSLSIAFDPKGNAIAVWSQTDGTRYNVWANRYVAATNTWQGARLIETNDSGDAFGAQVGTDPQGNAIVAWYQFDGVRYNIYANRYNAASDSWETAQLLETGDGSATEPQIGLDAQGNATVVWSQNDARTSIYANRYLAATGTWQGAQLLETDNTRDALEPRMSVSPLGDVSVIWNQTDVFVSRFIPTGVVSKLARTFQDPTVGTKPADLINVGRTQSYNAFGQVTQEVDAKGNTTDIFYNTRGDLTQKLDPQTSYTDNRGVAIPNTRPTTRYFYDYLGRLVGTQDAEGHKSTQSYDAAGHLVLEMNPNEILVNPNAPNLGFKQYKYDVRGDRRIAIDELGWTDRYTYDFMHHVTRIDRPTTVDFVDPPSNFSAVFGAGNAQRFDTYAYDEEGRRIRHTDALNHSDLTYYDSIGRVARTVSAAGSSSPAGSTVRAELSGTTTQYRYLFGVVDAAAGRVGTKVVTTEQTAQGPKTSVETKDYFGRLLKNVDLGGHQFFYTYNKAGWLIQQTGDTNLATPGNEQNITHTYYQNGLLKQTFDAVLNARTAYEYDRNGNVTFEGYERATSTGPVYYQTARARYDELNRVTQVDDPQYSITYAYDRNGNRRHVFADYHDGLDGTPQKQDYWYDYDAMNRFTVTQGSLVFNFDGFGNPIPGTGTIVAGTKGTQVTYYNDGQRKTSTYFIVGPGGIGGTTFSEAYQYADGLLTQTTITNLNTSAQSSATRKYDAVGRVKSYAESGGRQSTYDYAPDGMVMREVSNTTGTTMYSYDDAGTLLKTLNQQGATTIANFYSYEYWDAPKQSRIEIQATNPNAPNWKPGFSNFIYDVNGHLTEVKDNVAQRSLRYALDARGLVLQRNELSGGVSSKTQSYYYLNGTGIGDSGFTPSRTDYASVLASSGTNPKTATPISSADFGSNYMPINDRYPATTPGTYTLQPGEVVVGAYDQTLRNVALAVWGDASLWYLLADANGLNADSVLVVGEVLVIPNVVTNVHNSASTFQVYDAGEHIGDVSPTLPDPPPPPQKHGCGTLGIILIIVVAVVVTIVTEGAASELLAAALEMSATSAVVTVSAAAIGAAAGSIASQGVAMALGMQEHFSWSQVGMAALAAGVTAGVGAYAGGASSTAEAGLANKLGIAEFLGKDLSAAFNAMANNLVTQGIGKATGWQHTPFSWRSVAIAGLAGAAASEVGDVVQGESEFNPNTGKWERPGTDYSRWTGDFGTRLTTSFASGVATAAIRRRLTGSRLDYASVAADAFGTAVGQSLRASLSEAMAPKWTAADRDDFDLAAGTRAAQRADPPQVNSASGGGSYLSRGTEERLQRGQTVTDWPDPYATGGTSASPVDAIRTFFATSAGSGSPDEVGPPTPEQYALDLLDKADRAYKAFIAANDVNVARRLRAESSDLYWRLTEHLADPDNQEQIIAGMNFTPERMSAINNVMDKASALEGRLGDSVSYGEGRQFLGSYFGKEGLSSTERLYFHAAYFGAAGLFDAAPSDLTKPQLIEPDIKEAGTALYLAMGGGLGFRANPSVLRQALGLAAIEDLTGNVTLLRNLRPGDPVFLERPARTLVQDESGRYWLESSSGNRITPSGSYDFVTMPDGTIRVARPNSNPDFSTHLGLSGGTDVQYAGSLRFPNNTGPNRGMLTNWTNDSGHYQASERLNGNAGLPVQLFRSR